MVSDKRANEIIAKITDIAEKVLDLEAELNEEEAEQL